MNRDLEIGKWKGMTSLYLSLVAKLGTEARSPLKSNFQNYIAASIGGGITIALLACLTSWTDAVWVMAPFGASCVLASGVWDAPLSQPRNLIGGHLVSALVGVVKYHAFGQAPWVIAVSVGFAIGAMMLTRTTHPPAGANPIVVITATGKYSSPN